MKLKQFEPTGREKTELEMKESGFSPTDFLMDIRTYTGIPENKCTARKTFFFSGDAQVKLTLTSEKREAGKK